MASASLMVLSVVGCNGAEVAVGAQPLEIGDVAESPPESAAASAEHLDPLREHAVGALVRPAGLIDPTRVAAPDWISVEPSDLSTATRGTPPTLVFGPEASEYAGCAISGACLRLITYPEGGQVDCEVQMATPGYGDISQRIVLSPREELEDRWYAVEVRLDRDVLETIRRGDVQIARFRPDSYPLLSHALARGDGVVELRFSERVVGDEEASQWRVEDDEGELSCDVVGPARERPESHAVLSCHRPPRGVVRVRLDGTLHTVLGTELIGGPGDVLDQISVDLSTREGSRPDEVVRIPLYRE